VPFCLCVAGPNGSGKSTITVGLKRHFQLEHWIDPDALAVKEPGLDAEETGRRAFRAARNHRVLYATAGHNFGFETVFSHGSNLAFLRALKMLNYYILFVYIATEHPDINVKRVRNRIAFEGHSVPEQKIRDRYWRSLQLLSLAVRESNKAVIYDNSPAVTQRDGVLRTGKRACVITNDDDGSREEHIEVFPQIPNWVLEYALPPYSRGWQASSLCEQASARFGDDIYCEPTPDLKNRDDRIAFLRPFAF
jgi:predicted ABC-type ATPase